ncbi:staphylopine family metallophore export MFS transporter CntE [Paenibacillus cymbidii]|uniref:staphylopine family metallophore export MFS transporter CntE n=1 Tax=Paenibacillus cymbidii TaxID=1639034 RepID=UPI0010810F55|nr:MFS transporter [Paenibacillus cymbidii]
MKANRALAAPLLRLYALTLLFFSANAILNVIVPLQSATLGASNGRIGAMMGAYMLACMCFRPWAGHLIHKHGPAAVLRFLLVVNGLALAMYAFAGLSGYTVARVIQGACTAFFSMTLQIGIMDALPEEQRAQGVSLYSLFTYMPTVFGPLIAIALWQAGGMDVFAAVIIGVAMATAIFGWSVPTLAVRPQEDAAAAAPERQGVRGWQRQLTAQRPLVVCSLLMLIVSVVFGAVATFIPLYAKQVPHGQAGVYLTVQAAVIVAVRFAFRKRLPSDGKWHPRFVGGICLLAAAGAMMLSQAQGPAALYAAAAMIGTAQALLYPTLVAYLTFVVPRASRNVWIGLFIATADLGVSMGGMAMGPVADRLSYSAMYLASAGLAAGAACLVAMNRSMRAG